jgi:hypothetical protein
MSRRGCVPDAIDADAKGLLPWHRHRPSRSYAAFSQLIIHGIPNWSTNMPKR